MGSSTITAVVLSLAGVVAFGAEAPEDALDIMKKVAANTDAAAEARRQYVYHQKMRSGLLKSNGQVICRETREYTVVPQAAKTEKKLDSLSGECRRGKEMVPYSSHEVTSPGLKEKDSDEDGRETIAGLMNDLANDRHSRDGIPRELFPLGSKELPYYRFSLKGETTLQGRRTFDILFEPAPGNSVCADDDDSDCDRPWKGEAWIDAEDYQPIRIDTKLAPGIPWGVRVLLGTNIQQLGFSLTYQRVAAGVWFPATYGTEFHFVVLWGFKRTITMSMENTDFRKTDAQSSIQFEQ